MSLWAATLRGRLPGLVCLLALAALACASTPPARAPGGLFLWTVAAGSNGAEPSYLLGSMHLGTGDHAYDPAITAAFRAADTLVMEVPPADLDPARSAQLLLRYGRIPAGKTLRDLLTPEQFERLERGLAEQGLDAGPFLTLKPWVVLLALASREFAEAGFVAEEGVDQYFRRRATSRKPILGLETIESQFAVFDALPLELQVEALVGVAEQDPESPVDPAALADAWRRGDLAGMEAIIFPDRGEDPRMDAFYEAMYFRRNEQMSHRIDELLRAGGRLFVVVGAGHMLGARGIPALLERRGFRVEQVPRTPRGDAPPVDARPAPPASVPDAPAGGP